MTPEEIQTLKSLNLAYKKILTEYFKTPDQFKAIILLLKANYFIVESHARYCFNQGKHYPTSNENT